MTAALSPAGVLVDRRVMPQRPNAYDNSADAMEAILALHFPEGSIIDVNFGLGVFYRNGARARVTGVDIRDTGDVVVRRMDQAKTVLGYPTNGSNGIGHPHVHITGARAYEVENVLAKVIADHQRPTGFRGVDYDGLTVRYTQDPAKTQGFLS